MKRFDNAEFMQNHKKSQLVVCLVTCIAGNVKHVVLPCLVRLDMSTMSNHMQVSHHMQVRLTWRKVIRERCSNFERKRVDQVALKCALSMQDDSAVPTDVLNELKCSVCGRFLLSKAGMVITSTCKGRDTTKQFMRTLCLHVQQNPPVLHVA